MHPVSGMGMIEVSRTRMRHWHVWQQQMDGSRRYSKIYCKTQAGADALTAGRGALSSSARQLLILLDGERDFDELSRIFGEETLYRVLPFLESQGFVEPLKEHTTAQNESLAPTTVARTTVLPTTVLQPAVPTVTQVAEPPATVSAPSPVQASAKSPRFLAVPIAILASLATAAAIVNWVFEREQHAAESPQQTQDVTRPATPAVTASKPPSSGAGSSAPNTGVQTAQIDSSDANAQPTHPPPTVKPALPPLGPANSVQGSVPTIEKGSPPVARGKANAETTSSSSTLAVSDASPLSVQPSARPAQRSKVASDSTVQASKPSTEQAKTPPDGSSAQGVPRPKTAAESASATTQEPPTRPEPSSAAVQGTLALAAPDHTTAQSPAPAPALVGLHVRNRVLPTISKRALDSGIYGGKLVVRLHVNLAGTVERVELVSANPPEVYGPDVQHALEQWTFEPPSNPAQFTLDLDFRQQPPQPVSNTEKPAETPQSATSSQ